MILAKFSAHPVYQAALRIKEYLNARGSGQLYGFDHVHGVNGSSLNVEDLKKAAQALIDGPFPTVLEVDQAQRGFENWWEYEGNERHGKFFGAKQIARDSWMNSRQAAVIKKQLKAACTVRIGPSGSTVIVCAEDHETREDLTTRIIEMYGIDGREYEGRSRGELMQLQLFDTITLCLDELRFNSDGSDLEEIDLTLF